jgi:hypothetical protein
MKRNALLIEVAFASPTRPPLSSNTTQAWRRRWAAVPRPLSDARTGVCLDAVAGIRKLFGTLTGAIGTSSGIGNLPQWPYARQVDRS